MAANPTLLRLRQLVGDETADEMGLPGSPPKPRPEPERAAEPSPKEPASPPQMRSPRSMTSLQEKVNRVATRKDVRPDYGFGHLSKPEGRRVAREQMEERSDATMAAFQAALQARREQAALARQRREESARQADTNQRILETHPNLLNEQAVIPSIDPHPAPEGIPVRPDASPGEAAGIRIANELARQRGDAPFERVPPIQPSPEIAAADKAFEAAREAQSLNRARATGEAPPYTQTKFRNFLDSSVKGVLGTAATGVQGLGRFAAISGPAIMAPGIATPGAGSPRWPSAEEAVKRAEASAIVRWGEAMEKRINAAFPGDPARNDEILTAFAQGAGSAATFVAIGGIASLVGGPAAGAAAVAGAGAGVQGESGWDDAVQHGAEPIEKIYALIGNAGLGTTEAIPIAHFFGRLGAIVGPNKFRQFVSQVKGQAIEEAIQEGGTQLGYNAIAQAVYDTERDLGEGVLLNSSIGAVLGGIMGAGAGGVGLVRRGRAGNQNPAQPGAAPGAQGQPGGENAAPQPAAPTAAEPVAPGQPAPVQAPAQPADAEAEVAGQEPAGQGATQGAVPPDDVAILRGAGWLDEQIASMDDEERANLVQDALDQGVQPVPGGPPVMREPPIQLDTIDVLGEEPGIVEGTAPEPLEEGPVADFGTPGAPTSAAAGAAQRSPEEVARLGRELRDAIAANPRQTGQIIEDFVQRHGITPDEAAAMRIGGASPSALPEQAATTNAPTPEQIAAAADEAVGDGKEGSTQPRTDGTTVVVPETDLNVIHGSPNAGLTLDDISIVRPDGQKSERTVYLRPEDAKRIADQVNRGVLVNGRLGNIAFPGEGGRATGETRFFGEPQVGLVPLELSGLQQQPGPDGRQHYTGARIGPEITSVDRPQVPESDRPKLYKPRGGKATGDDLLTFVGSRGLAPNPELTAIGLDAAMLPGYGRIVRKGGWDLDRMREAAAEAGYLGVPTDRAVAETRISDLLDLLDRALRGEEIRPPNAPDSSRTKRFREREEQARASAEEGARIRLEEDVVAFMEANDIDTSDTELVAGTVDLLWNEFGLTIDEAIERVAIRLADTEPDLQQELHDEIPDEIWSAAAPETEPVRPGSAEVGEGSSDDAGGEPPAGGGAEGGQAPSRGGEGQRSPSNTTDITPVGEQTVIPGAERIGDKERAQRGAEAPLRPSVPQQGVDGLFGDSADQMDLVDAVRSSEAAETASLPEGKWPHETMPAEDIFPKPDKTVRVANDVGKEYISQATADARVADWKEVAKRLGKSEDNSNKVIISLFDYTGAWSQPFRDAGYQVAQYDIQFAKDRPDYEPGDERYDDILQHFPSSEISEMKDAGFEIVGVMSACPCTTFAGSGARWWESLHDKNSREAVEKVFGPWVPEIYESPVEVNRALEHATEAVIELANPTGFHVLENPIGRIERETGLPPPALRFDPSNYGDPYTKRTSLYGTFKTNLPTANVDPVEGSKIQSKLSSKQKVERSKTPDGFAYAFFMAQHPTAMAELEKLHDERSQAARSAADMRPAADNGGVREGGAVPAKAGEERPAGAEAAPAGERAPDSSGAAPAPVERPRPGLTPVEAVRDNFLAGNGFKTITEARRFLNEHGFDGTEKAADEAIEEAVVLAARAIIDGKGGVAGGHGGVIGDPAAIFDDLVDLYNRQPKLTQRTSQSMADQAYSTPVPLAYVASRLAGVDYAETIYEPAAGNGALLIEAPQNGSVGNVTFRVRANEINPDRAAALRRQGFSVTQKDATEIDLEPSYDVVIANPPFGAVREGGKSKTWTIGNYTTSNVDYAIAMKALEGLKKDGRAVLIVGSVNPRSDRKDGYRSSAKRKFFHALFKNYNVTDLFTVSGELYARQGAGWPVDVIVIEGRGTTKRPAPGIEPPPVLNSWFSLKEKISGEGGESEQRPGERPDRRPGSDAIAAEPGPGQRNGLGGETPGGRGPVAGQHGVSQEPEPVGGPRDQGKPNEPEPELAPGPFTDRGGDIRGTGPAPTPRRDISVNEANQAPYRPASKTRNVNTLVPGNMAQDIDNALAGVQQRRGDVDEFVAKELGYPVKELSDHFSAEQVDALALAIDNVKQGSALILGDQTGIGKGRVAAGMIRWAQRNGLTPVFFTEKPGLYGDMLGRDMAAIGMKNQNVFMTNVGETIAANEAALDWQEEVKAAEAAGAKPPPMPEDAIFLKSLSRPESLRAMDRIMSGDDKPDVIFTTYSQVNTVKGDEPKRRSLLRSIAPRAMFILDETHNAAGQGVQTQDREAKGATPNRAAFVRELVKNAAAVMYSSATYAKTPNVMDLYSRTDMMKGVDSPEDLPRLVLRGGVPLQQVLAGMLTRAGQYLRRERSFEGIPYNLEAVPVDGGAYEDFTSALRAIYSFDRAFSDTRQDIASEITAAEFAGVAADPSLGDAAASSTEFSSIMHNLINQMILAIKARQAADQAIAALKADQKPIITLYYTMESFLTDYMADRGLGVGDDIDLTFRNVMRRYLERTLRFTVKLPGGDKVHRYIPLERVPEPFRTMYQKAMAEVDGANVDALPVSPIDAIRQGIEDAGYSVAEVTGRSTMIDYSGYQPKVARRPASERGANGARQTVRKFNNGTLDAVILNASGSTGISMHSAPEFKDQRQRHMIIVQAAPNIDTHMQTLGRPNRTGQVNKPRFTQMIADIPAEARPAAVLMKKMASLNANTTASRKSALSADAIDFINPYGDLVVAQMMEDSPEWYAALGYPGMNHQTGEINKEDLAKRVTGALTLLLPKDQQELLDQLQDAYKNLIEQLDARGENALEAKTLPFQARSAEKNEIVPSKGDSVFEEPAYLERMSIKSPGRAMKPEEVVSKTAEAIGLDATTLTGTFGQRLRQIESHGQQAHVNLIRSSVAAHEAWAKEDIATVKKGDARAKRQAKHESQRSKFSAIMQVLKPGARVTLDIGDDATLEAVVIAVTRNSRTENPLAPSTWYATFAVPTSANRFVVPFSQIYPNSTGKPDSEGIGVVPSRTPAEAVESAFVEANKDGREDRTIITGNVLAGYDAVRGKGQIINFTMEDGTQRPGILMPRGFKMADFQKMKVVRFTTGAQVRAFVERTSGSLSSSDGYVEISPSQIITNAARAKGGRYFLDPTLRNIVGEFTKKKVGMSSPSLSPRQVEAAAQRLIELGAKFETNKEQDIAADVVKNTPVGQRTIAQRQPGTVRPRSIGDRGTTVAQEVRPPLLDDMPPAARARLRAEIRDVVRQISGKDVDIVDEIEDDGSLASDYERWDARRVANGGSLRTVGRYVWDNKIGAESTITVGTMYNSDAIFTGAHEAFHEVWFNLLRDAERDLVAASIPALRQWLVANGVHSEADAQTAPDYEVVADAFALWRRMRMGGQSTPGLHAGIRRAFQRMLDFMARMYRLMTSNQDYRDIFEKANRGVYQRTRVATPGSYASVRMAEPGSAIPSNVKSVSQTIHTQPPLTGNSTFAATGMPSQQTMFGRGLANIALRTSKKDIDWWRVKTQDSMLYWRRIGEMVESETGHRLPSSMDVYGAETLFPGRAGTRLEDLRYKHLDPLLDDMRAAGVSLDELGGFLYAKHAPERNREMAAINNGEPDLSGMSDREAQDYLDGLSPERAAVLQGFADRMYAIRDWTLDMQVRSGLLSRQEADEWKAKYQNYVPLRGFEAEQDDGASLGIGRGFDVRGRESRAALGRRSRADNPALYLILQAQRAIVRSEKNRVNQTLLRLVQGVPSPAWRIYKGEYKRVLSRDPLTGDGLVIRRWVPAGFTGNDENLIGVKVGGKQSYIEIRDPDLLRALKSTSNMGPQSEFIAAMQKATRFYASLQTRWNPDFIAPNWFRDIQTALVNVLDTEGKPPPKGTHAAIVKDAITIKAVRKVFKALRNPGGPGEYETWFEEYRSAGGMTSYLDLNSIDQIRRKLNSALNAGKLRRVGEYAIDLIDDMNGAVENGVRLSVYIHLRKNGFTKDRAAQVAKDLTVNFNRKGEWSAGINAFYMFFNASMQGSARMLKALRSVRSARRAVIAITAFGFLMDMLNYLVGGDDDDNNNRWDSVPDFVKNRNIVIMMPWGNYVSIPMAYGYNFFFNAGANASALMRHSMKMGRGKTVGEALPATLLAGLDAFNPMGQSPTFSQFLAPTFLDPVVQLGENKSFSGYPIHPEKYDRYDPNSSLYFANAPWWAKDVARILNSATGGDEHSPGLIDISPDDIQHVVEFAGGGTMRTATRMVSVMGNLWTGDEIAPEDIPVFRRFYGSTNTGTAMRSAFYQAWDEVAGTRHYLREVQKDGNSRRAAEVQQQDARLLAIYGQMNGAYKQVRNFRRQRDAIQNDRSLSNRERRQRLDALLVQEKDVLARALKIYEDAINQ